MECCYVEALEYETGMFQTVMMAALGGLLDMSLISHLKRCSLMHAVSLRRFVYHQWPINYLFITSALTINPQANNGLHFPSLPDVILYRTKYKIHKQRPVIRFEFTLNHSSPLNVTFRQQKKCRKLGGIADHPFLTRSFGSYNQSSPICSGQPKDLTMILAHTLQKGPLQQCAQEISPCSELF